MAIYHFSVKTVSRSTGRSAVAAAAYRSASKLVCPRTGLTHDYRRRQRGVLAQRLFLPRDLTMSRQQIWSAAELAETRKNSTVAREIEVALPHELTLQQQQALLSQFARELIEKHGVAVDIAIHAPSKSGDQKNVHAHILMTTRRILETGQLGEKTREWDDRKSGTVEFWRERWSQIVNEALERAGCDARIDHRSLKEQGIDRVAGRHHGVSATAIERKRRGASRRIDDLRKEQQESKKQKNRARALEILSSTVADVVDTEKAALDLELKSRSALAVLKPKFDSAIQDAEKRAREMRAHAARLFKTASEKQWPECELIIKEVVALLKEADAIAPEKLEKKQHDSKDVRYRLFANAARLEDYCDDDDENSRERPVC